jgi:hypothetical protein
MTKRTRRTELAVIAYVLFLVCAAFVQATHEAGWDTPPEPATVQTVPADTVMAMVRTAHG